MKENGVPINVNHYFNQLKSPLMSLLEPVFGGKDKTYEILCMYSTFKKKIIFIYSISLILKKKKMHLKNLVTGDHTLVKKVATYMPDMISALVTVTSRNGTRTTPKKNNNNNKNKPHIKQRTIEDSFRGFTVSRKG